MTYWVPTLTDFGNTASSSASSPLDFENSSNSSPLDNLMAYVVRKFKDAFGIVFEQGLIKVARGIFDNLEAKFVKTDRLEVQDTGITITDSVTGQPVCIRSANNILTSTAGPCAASTPTPIPTPQESPPAESTSPTPEPSPDSTDSPQATETPPAESASPTPSPEPSVEPTPDPTPESTPELTPEAPTPTPDPIQE